MKLIAKFSKFLSKARYGSERGAKTEKIKLSRRFQETCKEVSQALKLKENGRDISLNDAFPEKGEMLPNLYKDRDGIMRSSSQDIDRYNLHLALYSKKTKRHIFRLETGLTKAEEPDLPQQHILQKTPFEQECAVQNWDTFDSGRPEMSSSMETLGDNVQVTTTMYESELNDQRGEAGYRSYHSDGISRSYSPRSTFFGEHADHPPIADVQANRDFSDFRDSDVFLSPMTGVHIDNLRSTSQGGTQHSQNGGRITTFSSVRKNNSSQPASLRHFLANGTRFTPSFLGTVQEE